MAAGPSPTAVRSPALKPKARASSGTEALQRRMKVGAAGDRFEREADRIADHVVGSSALPAAAPPPVISPLSVQREAMDEERETGPEEPEAQLKAGPEKPAKEDELSKALKDETAQRAVTPAASAKPSDDEIDKTVKSGGNGSGTAQRAMRAAGPEAPKGEDELSKALNAQRDAKGPGAKGGTAPSGVESGIRAMRSGPAPGLAAPVRSRMENKMGVDLGGVRVHSGASAGKAADTLNARAFTVGQDMFFGRGQYDPVSTPGQRLIAHETAHTVQQRGGSAGVQRIQRTEDTTKTVLSKIEGINWSVDFTKPDGESGTITVPSLKLPIVAGGAKGTTVANGPQPEPAPGWTLPVLGINADFKLKPVSKRDTKTGASVIWTREAKKNYAAKTKIKLENRLKETPDVEPMLGKRYVLYSGSKKASSALVMIPGTLDELSQNDGVLRPMMDRNGKNTMLDADHILELQIGGKDSFDNMWLLEAGFNRGVGSKIKSNLNASISNTLKEAEKQLKKENADPKEKMPTSAEIVKRKWVIKFKKVKASSAGFRKETQAYWTRKDIAEAKQVEHFHFMTVDELITQGFLSGENGAGPKWINVFPKKTGGWVSRFDVSKSNDKLLKPKRFYTGMTVIGDGEYFPLSAANKNGLLAKIPVKYKRKNKGDNDIKEEEAVKKIDIMHDEALGFGGYVSKHSIRTAFEGMTFTPLSPMSFPNVEINTEGALSAQGVISASKALLPGLDVPITLLGNEIFIEFPIPTDKLKFGPVSVTEAALAMGVSKKQGFFISGQAAIAIDKLGKGLLTAKTSKKDTVIGGKFVFDFNFVESAEVAAEYSLAKDDFKAKGKLKVKKGTLPGVESGTIEIDATRQTFGVTGTLQLGGALTGSTITVGYTPETGLLIEGKDIPLPVDRLPGVSDAKVTVRAQRSPDTGEWLLSGAGSAALKAPGASGTLTIAVKGEQVYFDGRIDLAKGPAKGFILVTATNLQMDETGKPIEGGPVGPLQIWGKGQASIAFGKVLTGTAGIEYTREGKIIIAGEIALPPTVDLFRKIEYNKRLLQISPPDFPIWGVKLGPVGIGIFAFVDARLDFLAYVGPGQLRDTKVNATMDIDKPSEAKVEGNAQFFVPAYAGFKLDLGGGLKAQAAVAYVKGRVGLDGTLGLGVEGKIDVGVNWNVTDGLAFNANANVKASPKFELGVNASVTAGVSLPWPLSDIDHTWGPWRKKLGEFGPNMELSADFPVAWSEKKGLDFDINKIKVTKPKLDAKSLMKSAFDTLV